MTQSPVTQRPVVTKAPRLARLLGFLLPAGILMTALFNGVQQVLIPAQVEAFDPVHKVGNLALLTTFAAVGSLVGLPLGGLFSDRTRSRFGRRTPWLVGLSLVSGVLMIAMGLSENLIMLAIVYTVLWLTSNGYQGALLAIIPDRIPEERRGWAGSIIGLCTPLGVLVGVQVASHVSQLAGYTILAILLVVATLALVIGARERPSNEITVVSEIRTEISADRDKPASAFFSAFRSRDFTLAFISRFALFLSYFTVSGYLFYTLSDFIGVKNVPGGNVAQAVSTLLTVSVVGWVLIATFFGWLADKLNRRKLFVGISAVGLGLTMFIPIISPTWTGMLIYSAFLGIFIGVYFAVDLAVMSLVLPNPDREGRDFGILAVATGLPQIMSAVIAGGIITFLGGYTSLYMFGALCALVGGVTIFFIRKVR